MGIIFLE